MASIPPLTLEEVFAPRDLSKLSLDPARLRTLVATGDIVPGRQTDGAIRKRKDDFAFTVAATKDILAAGDVTLVNLEAPLVKNCPPHDSGFRFCGRPGFTTALKTAGVDVVTLESNHITDYGQEGIAETITHLQAAGMSWADNYMPAVVNVRGDKFGFLAFNGVGGRFDRTVMVTSLRKLRPQVDVLVVAMHAGAEYVSLPAPAPGIAPDNPIDVAHLAIDTGADLVIGNHPHWVQAVELYQGKFIAYAHGNFIFDQMWSTETRTGVIGRYTFCDRTLVQVEFVPVRIVEYAQPVPLKGKEADEVLDGMRKASLELAHKVSGK